MGDRQLYFAYGSHMLDRQIRKLARSRRFVGIARLPDHRLIFTRKSKLEGGFASLERELTPGLSVFGALYEVNSRSWKDIDRDEGESYSRLPVMVDFKGEWVRCETYFVRNGSEEILPQPSYMESICRAAQERGLPSPYIAFLTYLKSFLEIARREDSLLLTPTQDRSKSRGMPLVRLNKRYARERHIKRYCAIRVAGYDDENSNSGNGLTRASRYALAKVVTSESVLYATCQADQSLRNCIGVSGLRCFGHRVSVTRVVSGGRVRGRLPSRSLALIQPRALILQLHSLSKADTEKNYCVLHPTLIKTLGLLEGDYVRVYAVPPVIKGEAVLAAKTLRFRSATLRVFAGIGTSVERSPGKVADYPQPTEIYIDKDGRRALGLEREGEETPSKEWVDTPILVRPALWRAFSGRSIFNGITVFLGIDAFSFVLGHFFPRLQGRDAAIAAIVAALAVTGWLSVLDLRGRLRY